ncbi:MAG: SRPBCC family protein [Proteobacteria bacterium]|nr:SRPBCC family protein [Pseudomonadota bacterium]
MADQNEELGTITRGQTHCTATLTRQFDHNVEAVWQMLTDPARFVDWLAPGEIELRCGGVARLDFQDSGIVIDSTVTECDPGRVLAYSWSSPGEPDRPLRFELESNDDGCQLTLTLGVPEGEDVARSCAGWEAHLMMLIAAIEGVPIKFPFERFVATRAAYGALLELEQRT